jgi:hypothetical protein
LLNQLFGLPKIGFLGQLCDYSFDWIDRAVYAHIQLAKIHIRRDQMHIQNICLIEISLELEESFFLLVLIIAWRDLVYDSELTAEEMLHR